MTSIKDQIAIAVCESCEENPYHNGDTRGNDYRWQDYLVCAEAVIKAIESSGYKIVPIEPTEDMLRAMTDPFVAINGDSRKAFESAYTAMLAAVPEIKP